MQLRNGFSGVLYFVRSVALRFSSTHFTFISGTGQFIWLILMSFKMTPHVLEGNRAGISVYLFF